MLRLTLALIIIFQTTVFSQSIGDFVSVNPLKERSDTLILPATHTFQYLTKTGDTLQDGTTVGATLDFTGYIPINDTLGWLSVSSETEKAQIAIFKIALNQSQKKWHIIESDNVDFTSPEVLKAISTVSFFCSGGLTPWNTVIVGEESDKKADANADGYDDVGWFVEVNPVTKKIANTNNQKLWKLGRMKHENICIASDKRTCYYGADSEKYGFVYKFIADKKSDLSQGKLYVLKMKKDKNSAKGTWIQVPNTTKEECNNTNTLAEQVEATNFSGVEDVEIGPNGKIYFTAKFSGQLYRFKDLDNKVTETEVYVDDKEYPIIVQNGDTVMLDWHSGTAGNDNHAFDNEGNLWVMNDGGNDGIWVVRADHTAAKPHIELFAETPKGAEPSGITFSKDFKYIFLSLQHPNSNGVQKDKTGKILHYNTSHTIVISRKQ